MSGTHSDCDEGCTDCPTCRGEVKRDSPVMHDLGFAMAMAPKGGDPFWNAMGVAQMVRDGVKARGCSGAGDKEILDFVEGVAHAKVLESAGSPWGGPGIAFDLVPPWPPVPWHPPMLPPLILKSSPVGETVRDRKERQAGTDKALKRRVPGYTLVRVNPPATTVDPGVANAKNLGLECCVRDLLYPASWYPWTAGLQADLPRMGVHFEVDAYYWPRSIERPKCACECCKFEQFAFLPLVDGKFVEDCKWIDINDPNDIIRDANGKVTGFRSHAAVLELPPRDKEDPSKLAPGIRLLCPGAPGEPGAWGAVHQKWDDGGCHYWLCDEPGFPIAHATEITLQTAFYGRIVDVCHQDAVKAEDMFVATLRKTKDSWKIEAGVGQGSGEGLPIPIPRSEPGQDRPVDEARCG